MTDPRLRKLYVLDLLLWMHCHYIMCKRGRHILLWKAKIHYLPKLQVSGYCLLAALQSSVDPDKNVGSICVLKDKF